MEQGQLPAEGVYDTVLDALGKILGLSADQLRRAGRAVAPGPSAPPGEAPAFARTARAEPEYETRAPAPASEREAGEEWDEVDRLFRGG